MLSCVRLFATPWTVALQAPLSMGFSRQEYWSGLPFPSPGDLPKPGIKLVSPVSPALAGGFFTTSSTWKALFNEDYRKKKKKKSHSVCVYSNGEKTMYACWCSVAKSCRTFATPGLQLARFPCPSVAPGVCSNSRPLSR